jgi:hypothetical protein
MSIEMYNNVPTSKDVSIIVDQYSLTAIEPATHRLLRFGYLTGGYNHKNLCIVLTDLLETMGYSCPSRQMITIDKVKSLPKLTCRVRTLNNGVRTMRCIPIDSIEDYLQYTLLRSSNIHVKEISHKILKNLPELLSIVYSQHEILESSLAYNIAEKLKTKNHQKKVKKAARKLFEEQPIFKITEEETKHRKRRLIVA